MFFKSCLLFKGNFFMSMHGMANIVALDKHSVANI